MFKVLLFSFFILGSAFAQDMSHTETFETAYVDEVDGSSRYIGKCSTHDDYEGVYFKSRKVIQDYAQPDDMSEAQIEAFLKKFDKSIIRQMLENLAMYDIAEAGASEVSIIKDYFDDVYGEVITHKLMPGLTLIRMGFGVGGGNGGYMVFRKTAGSYELMSYTFDSDVNYCDKAVWL